MTAVKRKLTDPSSTLLRGLGQLLGASEQQWKPVVGKDLELKTNKKHATRILVPVLLLTSGVTLGKLPNISGPSSLL